MESALYYRMVEALASVEGYSLEKAIKITAAFLLDWKHEVGGEDKVKERQVRERMRQILPLTVKGKALHFLHPLHGSKSTKPLIVYRGHGDKDTRAAVSTSRDFYTAKGSFGQGKLTGFAITPATPAVDIDRVLAKRFKGVNNKYAGEREVIVHRSHSAVAKVTEKSVVLRDKKVVRAVLGASGHAKRAEAWHRVARLRSHAAIITAQNKAKDLLRLHMVAAKNAYDTRPDGSHTPEMRRASRVYLMAQKKLQEQQKAHATRHGETNRLVGRGNPHIQPVKDRMVSVLLAQKALAAMYSGSMVAVQHRLIDKKGKAVSAVTVFRDEANKRRSQTPKDITSVRVPSGKTKASALSGGSSGAGARSKGGGSGKGGGWRTIRGRRVYFGGDGKAYHGKEAVMQYRKEKV